MIKLITEHKDYLLLVDTETTSSCEYLLGDDNKIYHISKIAFTFAGYTGIIAASPKLGDLPLLPELPKREENIDTDILAADFYSKSNKQEIRFDLGWMRIFNAGYKAALKKWSDEDIECFFLYASSYLSVTEEVPNYDLFKEIWEGYLDSCMEIVVTLIVFEPEYEDSEQYEVKPLPIKPYEGMKVMKDGRIGTVIMYPGLNDGSWTWAGISEFSYWQVSELTHIVYAKQLKIVNGVLQGTFKFKE